VPVTWLYGLPNFQLREWQHTGAAINDLASELQQSQGERQKLLLKLMTLQEEERRYLARELHDELGQCLAAINAVAVSINHTANQKCPELVPEVDNILRINQHSMSAMHDLLVRIRPAELETFGLEASLRTLITEWRSQTADQIQYQLSIEGPCNNLPEHLQLTLFRIAQEGLTNVAKHAKASSVILKIEATSEFITLAIEDNGSMVKLPAKITSGFGLLGIRERVLALNGNFALQISKHGGLTVQVKLPFQTVSGSLA
jgi:two-component system, NarL family, sensor histidine kinase UhpB